MPQHKTVIIVVDDDPAVCDALQFSLELEGYKVYTCPSGEDLLAHRALKESECIVLDYKMPGLSGLDVLNRLSERGLAVPVIIITGPMNRETKRRLLAAGAKLVLEKPLLDKGLSERIRELTT